MEKRTLKVYCDGASRGNPGPAASSFVVFMGGNKIAGKAYYLGNTTNNVAEYTAILKAIEWILKNFNGYKVTSAEFYLDSLLAVRQINGEYRVKSKNIKPLILKILSNQEKLPFDVIYKHVRRDRNKLADILVNKVLDEKVL